MNKIDFLKEWYYKEDERKDCLNNSLNIPIGILTAILAAIYFLFNTFNYETGNDLLNFLFITSASVAMIFWIICIYYLLKSYNDLYKGYTYKAFPKANFLEDEEENLNIYIETYREDLPSSITLDLLLQQNIEKMFVECIDTNVYNNDRKSAYLHSSKIHILNCILLLFIASVCFTFNYISHKKEDIHQIEIINFKDMSIQRRPPPPPRQEPRPVRESEQPKTRPTPPQPPRPKN